MMRALVRKDVGVCLHTATRPTNGITCVVSAAGSLRQLKGPNGQETEQVRRTICSLPRQRLRSESEGPRVNPRLETMVAVEIVAITLIDSTSEIAQLFLVSVRKEPSSQQCPAPIVLN